MVVNTVSQANMLRTINLGIQGPLVQSNADFGGNTAVLSICQFCTSMQFVCAGPTPEERQRGTLLKRQTFDYVIL